MRNAICDMLGQHNLVQKKSKMITLFRKEQKDNTLKEELTLCRGFSMLLKGLHLSLASDFLRIEPRSPAVC